MPPSLQRTCSSRQAARHSAVDRPAADLSVLVDERGGGRHRGELSDLPGGRGCRSAWSGHHRPTDRYDASDVGACWTTRGVLELRYWGGPLPVAVRRWARNGRRGRSGPRSHGGGSVGRLASPRKSLDGHTGCFQDEAHPSIGARHEAQPPAVPARLRAAAPRGRRTHTHRSGGSSWPRSRSPPASPGRRSPWRTTSFSSRGMRRQTAAVRRTSAGSPLRRTMPQRGPSTCAGSLPAGRRAPAASRPSRRARVGTALRAACVSWSSAARSSSSGSTTPRAVRARSRPRP